MKTGEMFTALALLSFISGCDNKPTPTNTVKGRVFVVQKDGESRVLGGIDVYMVESNAFFAQLVAMASSERDDINDRLKLVREERETIEQKRLKLVKQRDAAVSEMTDLSDKMGAIGQAMQRFSKSERATANETLLKFQIRIYDLKTSLDASRRELSSMPETSTQIDERIESLKQEQSDGLKLAQVISRCMSNPITVMTDIDGIFEFRNAPTSGVVLVSFGQRELMKSKEIYCWIVPPEYGRMTLLNNRNMTKPSDLLADER